MSDSVTILVNGKPFKILADANCPPRVDWYYNEHALQNAVSVLANCQFRVTPPRVMYVPHDMVPLWEKQGYVSRGVVVDDEGYATDKTEMARGTA